MGGERWEVAIEVWEEIGEEMKDETEWGMI